MSATCGQCGGDIINRRADARFCSDRCRAADHRAAKHSSAERRVRELRTKLQSEQEKNDRLQARLAKGPSPAPETRLLLRRIQDLQDEVWRQQVLAGKLQGNWSGMSRAVYRKILSCLHTDRSASDKKLTEAFIAFSEWGEKYFAPVDKRTNE
jgi:hypothetical protein